MHGHLDSASLHQTTILTCSCGRYSSGASNMGEARVSAETDKATYEKCHFTCVYCGFDGRTFDGWMQLSIDHIRPRSCGGSDESDNRVAACRSCNSPTSRMTFEPAASREEMLKRSASTYRRFAAASTKYGQKGSCQGIWSALSCYSILLQTQQFYTRDVLRRACVMGSAGLRSKNATP
jgi:hypothetical protein